MKLFSISKSDQKFYQNFHKNVYLLNLHGHTRIKSCLGFGGYILYHGNFDVSENFKAVKFFNRKYF